MNFIKKNYQNLFMCIAGSFIFCLGVNLFVTPLNLYNGGVLGISQIIRSLLNMAGFNFGFDISGILNLFLNIPLMIMAVRYVSIRFFRLTLVSVIAQSLFFSLLPVELPIIDDMIASVLIGGAMAGFGIGLTLRSHGSGGGIDILGVVFAKKFSGFSVGKLAIIVNTIIFCLCGFLFNIQTAIYSILYNVFYTMIMDRVHYQNIEMTAMVFTKNDDGRMTKYILNEMHRGVTYWQGKGGYTHDDTYILITAISKYEMSHFKREVKRIDPDAFIIFSDNLSIAGNFEKRL